jgi:hypothetical protein
MIGALRFKSSKKDDLTRYAQITLFNSTWTAIHFLVCLEPELYFFSCRMSKSILYVCKLTLFLYFIRRLYMNWMWWIHFNKNYSLDWMYLVNLMSIKLFKFKLFIYFIECIFSWKQKVFVDFSISRKCSNC